MKLYTFTRGGIEFADPSAPSYNSTQIGFLPALSVIPLTQHPGKEAQRVVEEGEWVKEGMLIGRAQGPGSANIHASIPGRILKFVTWDMHDGRRTSAAVLRMEGPFEKLGKKNGRFPWDGLSPYDLQRLLAEKGVVEMEDPGRPVAELFHGALEQKDKQTLVIRCVFDDPWLVADRVLMEERLSEVVEGTAIALRASGINRVLFVFSKGTEDLSLRFSREAEKFKLPLTSVMVGTRYPQRNIRELEQALQRFEKHEGVELGGLCFLGVATLAAICDAVAYNKPVMERYVAVGGMALKNPLVIRVRIGTRIGDVFEECGGFSSEPVKIAVGSPLRGKRVLDLDEPITKTTTAIFALSAEQIGGIDTVDCINCGECRAVCPVGLDPERLFKLALSKKDAEASREGALECHGCGCCEILCPSRLPLSSVIRDSAIRGKQLTLSDSGGSL